MEQVIEQITLDEGFQAACQRYAHGNGSSRAIAAAAVRVFRVLESVEGPQGHAATNDPQWSNK